MVLPLFCTRPGYFPRDRIAETSIYTAESYTFSCYALLSTGANITVLVTQNLKIFTRNVHPVSNLEYNFDFSALTSNVGFHVY